MHQMLMLLTQVTNRPTGQTCEILAGNLIFKKIMKRFVRQYKFLQSLLRPPRPCIYMAGPEAPEVSTSRGGVARTSLHVGDTKQGRALAVESNSPQLCKECAQILEAQEKLQVP